MTIDNPIPNVGGGPELQQKFGNSISMFQEYSCPPPYPPGGAADHSLQQEVLLQSPSPCGVSMYEHEHSDKQTALLSPCSNISGCGSEFGWYDDGLSVKQEPLEENYFNFNKTLPCDEGWFENLQSDPLWSPGADSGVFKMEDVFQVDQSTVNCGPTLAQLNSPAEITAMMEEMDRRESWRVPQVSPTAPLPWQCATQTSLPCQTQATVNSFIKTENASQTTGSDPSQISTMNLQAVPAPVVQSLIAGLTEQSVGAASTAAAEHAQNETVQGRSASYAAGEVTQTVTPLVNYVRPLKRPAPDSQENSLDSKWEEIKQFIHSDLEQRQHEASSKQSHGKDIAYTPNEDIDSNDEGFGSDSCDSDVDDGNMCSDYSSDAESVDSVWHLLSDSRSSKKKKKRFFWQYNTQAKGPKGKRLCNTLREVDPHVLNDFSDPVFDPSVGDMKYKHSGKARRGEGNDVTPNPKKLFQIGNELKKLNRQIHDIAPAGDLPSTSRPKSRREKNKLASRACRLKKKAQHEAFKIKLHGLEMEHAELMQVIASVKQLLAERLREPSKASGSSMVEQCTMLEDKYWNNKVAHKTTEYVNTVIEQVAKGDATGGLGKLSII